jgi:hypothetical protein
MPDDTRERLARLETSFINYVKTFDEVKDKVDDMHELLLQAKGAKWAVISLTTSFAALAGFVSGMVSKFFPHNWGS